MSNTDLANQLGLFAMCYGPFLCVGGFIALPVLLLALRFLLEEKKRR